MGRGDWEMNDGDDDYQHCCDAGQIEHWEQQGLQRRPKTPKEMQRCREKFTDVHFENRKLVVYTFASRLVAYVVQFK